MQILRVRLQRLLRRIQRWLQLRRGRGGGGFHEWVHAVQPRLLQQNAWTQLNIRGRRLQLRLLSMSTWIWHRGPTAGAFDTCVPKKVGLISSTTISLNQINLLLNNAVKHRSVCCVVLKVSQLRSKQLDATVFGKWPLLLRENVSHCENVWKCVPPLSGKSAENQQDVFHRPRHPPRLGKWTLLAKKYKNRKGHKKLRWWII